MPRSPQRLPDRLPLLNFTRLDALLPFAFCALWTYAMPASAMPYSVTLLCACAPAATSAAGRASSANERICFIVGFPRWSIGLTNR